MKEARMEDHPDHWKSTLLGEDFWKDAEAFNQVVNDDIEAGEFDQHPFRLFSTDSKVIRDRTRTNPPQVSLQPRPRAGISPPTSQQRGTVASQATKPPPATGGRRVRTGTTAPTKPSSPSI